MNNKCWEECGAKGGSCLACSAYAAVGTNAFSSYCCSGNNHRSRNGPMLNGDCPDVAISKVQSQTHQCVYSRDTSSKYNL